VSNPIIGGADKLAFVQNRDIWLISLDGTELQRLTADGSFKAGLQWTPDGQRLLYIAGNCIRGVTAEAVSQNIACFSFVESPDGFAVSADGTKLAVSLDYQMYIIAFQPLLLNPNTMLSRNDVIGLARETCATFAPYDYRHDIQEMQWSDDGLRLALKIRRFGITGGPLQGKLVEGFLIIESGDCRSEPVEVDNFPDMRRLWIEGFENRPEFTDWSWDGKEWYTLTSHSTERIGWGDLYRYNGVTSDGVKLNPMSGKCCYREARWSPDGQYILFVYEETAGNRQVFYARFSSLNSGLGFTPLDLPEFSDPHEYTQPALRPAVAFP
jgi:Tol biopolymer transport system component